jgi:hypothetical protein
MTGNKCIVVCGDSFCSYEVDCKERHFSQILEEDYGYRVINIAKQGCSQTMIGFQVDAAINRYQSDIVIHNQTFPDRIDVKLDDDISSFTGSLDSFVYDRPNEASTQVRAEYQNATIKSCNLASLDGWPGNTRDLTARYLTEVTDYYVREYQTQWICEYWHMKILERGKISIPLLKDTDPGKLLYDFCNNGRVDYPTPFHTDEATQLLVAEQIDKIIKGC